MASATYRNRYTSSKQPRRWRPRFSLRAFLILFTLLSLWLGWRISVSRRVEGAVAQIEQSGCLLWYPTPPPEPVSSIVVGRDGKLLSIESGYDPDWTPTGPEHTYSARFLFGYSRSDLPDSISFVSVDDEVIAGLVEAINSLPSVAHVWFLSNDDANITGACCRSLAEMRYLRKVEMRGGMSGLHVGDDDLEEFALLEQIEYLDLTATKWSAAGIEALRTRLPNCEIVYEPTEADGSDKVR